ncbi:MAG TPA: hypothetical protein VNI01_03995 [Elusimicrobiota bacterium]|jgi:hypothetical protein|nr:hypothetical protein [Elusimicrobiota bacterium]
MRFGAILAAAGLCAFAAAQDSSNNDKLQAELQRLQQQAASGDTAGAMRSLNQVNVYLQPLMQGGAASTASSAPQPESQNPSQPASSAAPAISQDAGRVSPAVDSLGGVSPAAPSGPDNGGILLGTTPAGAAAAATGARPTAHVSSPRDDGRDPAPEPGDVYYGNHPGGIDPARFSSESGTHGSEASAIGIQGGSVSGPIGTVGPGGFERGFARGGAADEKTDAKTDDKTPPNGRTDERWVSCQNGYHHNFEALPPDTGLFGCLDAAKYCPSWDVYEPDRYAACLKRHGYMGGGSPADRVLYDCIYHPRGLARGQTFRDKPRTRNPRWVDIDYSTSGRGLYGDTPGKRFLVCLAEYRYLQGRFDHECSDPCGSMDPIRAAWGGSKNDFVIVPTCIPKAPVCAKPRVGLCIGDRYACLDGPAEKCPKPYPLCLENDTGAFTCTGGRWVCAQRP